MILDRPRRGVERCPRQEPRDLRLGNTLQIAAACLLLAGCSTPPHSLRKTDYPATIVGRVVKRTDPQHSPIPMVKESGEIVRSRPRVDYELRANDGSVLIVQAAMEFPVGACVSLSGYADGPSLTHFSFGRAELEASDQCR